MNHVAQAEKAQMYDRRIRAAIPGYEALHSLTTLLVAEMTGARGRTLVVGAGTGAECVAIGQSCPQMTLVGVDPAPEMIHVAEHKIAQHGLSGRVRFYPCQVADLPAFEPFDAATLLLVLHFLKDDGAKLSLLTDIAKHLKPDAPLLLADLFGPSWDDPDQARMRQFWVHLQRAAGIPETDVEAGLRHVDRAIHPVTEPRLAQLLDQAGFCPPLPYFRALCFGGWIARRKTS